MSRVLTQEGENPSIMAVVVLLLMMIIDGDGDDGDGDGDDGGSLISQSHIVKTLGSLYLCVLENIDIDEILNRLEFDTSNRAIGL